MVFEAANILKLVRHVYQTNVYTENRITVLKTDFLPGTIFEVVQLIEQDGKILLWAPKEHVFWWGYFRGLEHWFVKL